MKQFWKTLAAAVLSAALLVLGCACTPSEPKEEEPDLSKYPYYVDPEQASADSFVFAADAGGVTEMSEEVYRPYWYGNVIYNETVLLTQGEASGRISGKLLYDAVKILSVRNHDFTVTYQEGVDYTWSGNEIVRTDGSAIKYHTRAELTGDSIPEPYRLTSSISNVATDIVRMGATIYTESDYLYGYQVSVSYVYDVKDIEESYPAYEAGFAPKTVQKLKAGEAVNMTIIGDSVGEGCSSSGYMKHTPYMPPFINLVQRGLQERYQTTVNLQNKSKGGETSTWGSNDTQIAAVAATQPDILFVHFGINDCGAGSSQNLYYDNLQKLILNLTSACPNVEIVLIKCFTPEPWTYDGDMLEKYGKKIDELCAENDNVYQLDLYTLSTQMLAVKDYMDVTANGINHINDYTTRLYAMSILSKLCDFAE